MHHSTFRPSLMWLATAPLLEQDPPVPTTTAARPQVEPIPMPLRPTKPNCPKIWGNDSTTAANTLLARPFQHEWAISTMNLLSSSWTGRLAKWPSES
jgi:hypothetical protein